MNEIQGELVGTEVILNGGGTDDYPDLNNKPQINGVELVGNKTGAELGLASAGDIPTKTSDLTNDSGFITAQDIPSIPSKTSDLTNDGDGVSRFATENYVALNGGKIDSISVNGDAQVIDANKNVDLSVPTKTSDLNNDSGFITNTVNNLTNYYLKSETYTQAEVNALVATIKTIKVEIVQTLPTASAETYFNDSKTIYMVRNTSVSGNNYYDEYITVRAGSEGSYTYSWENIGSTQIDVSNKLDKDTTSTNTLYGKGSTADTQMMWRIDQVGNVGHAIAQRNAYGGLNVPTPTADGEATNKQYVDNEITNIVLTGATAPTTATVGKVNQLYRDTTTNKVYICTAVTAQGTDPETYTYTWSEVGGGSSGKYLHNITFGGSAGRNIFFQIITLDSTAYSTGTQIASGMINAGYVSGYSYLATGLINSSVYGNHLVPSIYLSPNSIVFNGIRIDKTSITVDNTSTIVTDTKFVSSGNVFDNTSVYRDTVVAL